ncbi:hypothetical protein DH2020_040927 [Rehmannia glutinosa]|uniref:Uncharacterized protein n=1 Tax=Rehmannia glutinosa TaxID=99300 RepID=A0ABR0URL5_REHGL
MQELPWEVSAASVNLTTEATIVCVVVSEAKVAPSCGNNIEEVLAKHLTTCGFKYNLRS